MHLAHIGHPLMGDAVYGPHFKTKAGQLGPQGKDALTALGRQALHAYLLALEHPEPGNFCIGRRPCRRICYSCSARWKRPYDAASSEKISYTNRL
ncbi:hypothetical protein ACF1BQ_036910 [Bradyrhizobium sp. RDT10]